MDRKRLFIAIDISDEVRSAIDVYAARLREVQAECIRWEKIEKIHLTLKFLGDTETSQVAEIESALASVAAGQQLFSLSVEGTGMFPNAQKARILWVGLNSGQLERVHSTIDTDLELLGIPTEARRFNPHLTIARIRDARQAKAATDEHLRAEFSAIQMPVNEITLYESNLLKSGSLYSVIRTFKLKDGDISFMPPSSTAS